jgi:hypothetical protein
VVFLSGDFYPNDKWTFGAGGTFSISEAAFDPIELELPEEVVAVGDYDYSGIDEYSDLDYRQIELWAKGSREISRNASLYVGGGYFDFTDDQPYVYGDLSGQVSYLQSGVQVMF